MVEKGKKEKRKGVLEEKADELQLPLLMSISDEQWVSVSDKLDF